MNHHFPTPLSLLAQLQKPDPSEEKWREFHDLYAPLILTWAQQQGFQDADARDVTQEVLIKLTQSLPTYVRGPGQSFRSWLYTISQRQGHDFRRFRARLRETGADPLAVTQAREPNILEEENEFRRALVHRARELIRHEFEEKTWRAFVLFKMEQKPVKDVMNTLGYEHDNAVYVASNRVLRRLREVVEGFVEE
jgi:RNA polymerase sigma factor (sigma-70 family)